MLSHQKQSLPARPQGCLLTGVTQLKEYWFVVSSPRSFWPQEIPWTHIL